MTTTATASSAALATAVGGEREAGYKSRWRASRQRDQLRTSDGAPVHNGESVVSIPGGGVPEVETFKPTTTNPPGMARKYSMDRRAYLKTVGVAGVSVAVAGCPTGGGNSTIVPGTASGFPPFEFTEGGELVGFDVDLAEETISRAGYDVGDWVDIEFDSLIPSLTEGDIDLVAAAMTINDERDRTIDFSDPYYESNQAVIVREGGSFDPASVEDLDGQRVGAQSGTTGEDQVQTLIDDGVVAESDYRQYDNYTLAVQDLENGNVDAIVVDVPVANNFADSRNVRVAFVIQTGEQFGFGMREDDDRIEDVNGALAEIQEDGTYDDLVAEWFE